MSEERKPTRLPPPAFPPGNHRYEASVPNGGQADTSAEVLVDALARPEDPASWDGGALGSISPDEPLPDRRGDSQEGAVTGIGNDPHLGPEDLVQGGDPHVRELTVTLAKLAEALRRRGEAGLRVTPDMSRFESTLRGYCLGYLVGRRAEDGASGRD